MGITCPKYMFAEWAGNVAAFFCQVSVSVLRWIVVMLIMSSCGFLYFSLAGIGNFVECRNPCLPLYGMIFSFISAFLPWWFRGRTTPADENMAQEFLEIVTFILGGCSIAVSSWQFISILVPETSRLWKRFTWFLVPSVIKVESRIKNAAAYKIDTMVANALKVHHVKKQESVVPTHFGQALLNYAESIPQSTKVGGFCWTWRMIWSRDLFRHEGVLFSGRLLSTNFIQV